MKRLRAWIDRIVIRVVRKTRPFKELCALYNGAIAREQQYREAFDDARRKNHAFMLKCNGLASDNTRLRNDVAKWQRKYAAEMRHPAPDVIAQQFERIRTLQHEHEATERRLERTTDAYRKLWASTPMPRTIKTAVGGWPGNIQ